MLVVKNIVTGRLVYREEPNFPPGLGLKNAVMEGLGHPSNLLEIKVAPSEWEAELALREQERPRTTQEQLDALQTRVVSLETKRA